MSFNTDRDPSQSKPYSILSPGHNFITPWEITMRKLLRDLSRTVPDASQLADLHITLQDDDELSVCPTSETLKKLESFFATRKYQGMVKSSLPSRLQHQPDSARACSESIASTFTSCVEDLGLRHSKNRTIFRKVKHVLLITGDTRTKGVTSTLTVQDVDNGQSISVLTQTRRQDGWLLNSKEIYALLTLADEQRRARPSANFYEVHIMTIHACWMQRLSAQIPSSYLTSIIDGEHEILGHFRINRTPWCDFTEEDGRRGAFRAMFEHFPLSISITLPPLLPPLPLLPYPKRESNVEIIHVERFQPRTISTLPTLLPLPPPKQESNVEITNVEHFTFRSTITLPNLPPSPPPMQESSIGIDNTGHFPLNNAYTEPAFWPLPHPIQETNVELNSFGHFPLGDGHTQSAFSPFSVFSPSMGHFPLGNTYTQPAFPPFPPVMQGLKAELNNLSKKRKR